MASITERQKLRALEKRRDDAFIAQAKAKEALARTRAEIKHHRQVIRTKGGK